jgi:hypothetical protein
VTTWAVCTHTKEPGDGSAETGAPLRSQITVSALLLAARRPCSKIMTPADLRLLHKYMLEVEKVSAISDEMRPIVESEWPELAHKLPPQR